MPTSYAGPQPASHSELTFFAFDDHSLPLQQNLALHLVDPRKHPNNPIMPRGETGPDAHGLQHGTILRQDGRFRYWYTAMHAAKMAPDDGIHIGYAESDDGIYWRRPVLGLKEWHGSKENNLILIEPADSPLVHPAYWPVVLYEPDEPDPARRYKMTFITWTHPINLRDVPAKKDLDAVMMTAESADGLSWRLTGDKLLIPEKFEVTGLYKFQGWYYATGQQVGPWAWLADGRECGRVVSLFRSRDFRHWSPQHAMAIHRTNQQPAPPGTSEETHAGVAVWNRNNVLVGFFGLWHGAEYQYGPDITVDLGLAVSNDGIHYREPEPDFKIIPRGNWDCGFIFQTHSFHQMGDETWVWYSGLDERGNSLRPHRELGLAMWRRDGFGYLDQKVRWEDGTLLTCPIGLDGGAAQVYVNVDRVGDGAWVKVEVLDDSDRPLPGFGADEAIPIDKPGLRQLVAWRHGDSVDAGRDLAGSSHVTLRVTLHGAGRLVPRLYALYVVRAQ